MLSGAGLVLCEPGAIWPKKGPWKVRQERGMFRVVARAQYERYGFVDQLCTFIAL